MIAESIFPYPYTIPIDGRHYPAHYVIEALAKYLTAARKTRIHRVVEGRTYSVLPVLEGLYDRGNVSAVLRSAEALGYLAVHIIETQDQFKQANRVTQGAEKWLAIRKWGTTADSLAYLREHGYRIVAATMEHSISLETMAFDQPTAIFFGNERDGLSNELMAEADTAISVPMLGFTRSFNISVAAALCLYHIQQDRRSRFGAHGDLTESERVALTAHYYMQTISQPDRVLTQYLQNCSD